MAYLCLQSARGLTSRTILLSQLVTHTRWKPLSLSLSVRVFSDPVNVCVPLVDLEDHTGVRPPPWWCQTTRDVRGKEENKKKEVRRRAERWGGEKLSGRSVSVTENQPCRKCSILEWANLDTGTGTDPTFHVVHHWTTLLTGILNHEAEKIFSLSPIWQQRMSYKGC